MRAAIEKRLKEFLASSDPRLKYHQEAARKHGFLPLYAGWLATLGIRPDGSFVRWEQEDDPETITELSNPYLQRMAICEGAKKYPELRALLPPRPDTAETCNKCDGTGTMRGLSDFVCHCGGAGWIIQDEDTGVSPG